MPGQGIKEGFPMAQKILIVEDELNIAQLLQLYLEKEEIGRASCRERV